MTALVRTVYLRLTIRPCKTCGYLLSITCTAPNSLFRNRLVVCCGFVLGLPRETPLTEVLSARELLDAQDGILERMACGAPLRETAEGIALLVERLVPSALCAIAVIHPDGQHLKPLAAPHMPPEYFVALDGTEVGPTCGTIGAAVWRREPVIVTDTMHDPLWKNLRDFATACSLRASWALPILHNDGTVLGVLSLYYREVRVPEDWDWSVLGSCIKLIRLALAAARREHELQASEERWRIGAETLGLGTFDIDFETGLDTWSPAMRQLLGVSDSEPACFGTLLARVNPDDRDHFLSRLSETPLSSSSGGWHEEVHIRRADTGEDRVLETKGCIIPSRDGKPRHAVGTLYDVTEQRRHEEELENARLEAEAANRAKSKFLASMSHELRTPLNAIIGFSDMMRSRVFGPMTPVRYEGYIDDIYKSGTHLLSLINDVLDMAKIEAQKFELTRTQVPLQRLADSAIVLVRPQAQAKNLRLELDIAAGVVLSADERALRQVLVNLLSNAVKFTGPGGTVRLFGAIIDGGGLALGVEDSGAGMSPQGLAIALEPFGQVQMDVTADRSGTGLGLPLAKAMIESHGATFRIESTLGVGTRVWGEFQARDVSSAIRQAG